MMTAKTILIHQPDFIPWVGFLERWKKVDHLIILDDVQFLKRGWHHRDRLILNNIETWYGLPVHQKGAYKKNINEIEIIPDDKWKYKLLKTIRLSYQKYEGFKVYFPWFEEIIMKNYESLCEINMDFLNSLGKIFKIDTGISYSSDFLSSQTSSERLIELCKYHQGTSYMTGMGSKDYLDENQFTSHNIEIIWHHTSSNIFYPQATEDELGLSILHCLLKYGNPKL